jgi:hypothetical protein
MGDEQQTIFHSDFKSKILGRKESSPQSQAELGNEEKKFSRNWDFFPVTSARSLSHY